MNSKAFKQVNLSVFPTALVLVMSGISMAHAQSQTEHPQEQRGSVQSEHLEPKMRAVDREWDYFKQVHCDDIGRVVFHSRSEEILLAKRKSQCMSKYKAFLPNPVDR